MSRIKRTDAGPFVCIFPDLLSSRSSQAAADAAKDTPPRELVKTDEATGLPLLPYWLAQPYFRPPPPTPKVKGELGLRLLVPSLIPSLADNVPSKRPIDVVDIEENVDETKRVKLTPPVAVPLTA